MKIRNHLHKFNILKFIYSLFKIIFLVTILNSCEKDKKNPYVILEASVDFPYVNFKNECTNGEQMLEPKNPNPGFRLTGSYSDTRCYSDGCWVTREYSNIESTSSGRIKGYIEIRHYENGGTYEIEVSNVEIDYVSGVLEGNIVNYYGVINYTAIVDGVEYSGLDMRYP